MRHLWGWALGLLLLGCEVAKPGENELACTCEAGARPVDPALLSFLSKARAAHHQADLAEVQGDRGRAVAALEAVVRGPAPLRRQESDEVLADTRARLAGLRAAQGQFDAAMQDIERGLELAREVSYFRGHLFEVQALVEEQRASSLAASPEAAAQARARAIRAAEQAIEIQDQVLKEALKRENK